MIRTLCLFLLLQFLAFAFGGLQATAQVFEEVAPGLNMGILEISPTGVDLDQIQKVYKNKSKTIVLLEFGRFFDRDIYSFDGRDIQPFRLALAPSIIPEIIQVVGDFAIIKLDTPTLDNEQIEYNTLTGAARILSTKIHSQHAKSFKSGYVYIGDPGLDLIYTEGSDQSTITTAEIPDNDTVEFGFDVADEFICAITSSGIYCTDGSLTGSGSVYTGNERGVLSHTNYDGVLFLQTREHLLSTDGTPSNTFELFTETVSSASPNIQDLLATPDGVVFTNSTSAEGREVYRTDGTIAGTHIIESLAAGNSNGVGDRLSRTNSTDPLLFLGPAANTQAGFVYRASSTELEPTVAHPIRPSNNSIDREILASTESGHVWFTLGDQVNRKVYHLSPTGASMRIDSFATGTNVKRDISTSWGDNTIYIGKADNEVLFFNGQNGDFTLLPEAYKHSQSRIITPYTYIDERGNAYYDSYKPGTRYYSNESLTHHVNMETGEVTALTLFSPDQGEYPDLGKAPEYFEIDNTTYVYTSGPESQNGPGLYQLEGNNVTLIQDLFSTTASTPRLHLAACPNDYVYATIGGGTKVVSPNRTTVEFTSYLDENTESRKHIDSTQIINDSDKLWVLNGHSQTAFDISSNSLRSSNGVAALGPSLYHINIERRPEFINLIQTTREGLNPDTIWRSSFSSVAFYPYERTFDVVSVNGSIYFPYYSAATGWEVGISDGTESGTGLYRDFTPGATSSAPIALAGANEWLVVQPSAINSEIQIINTNTNQTFNQSVSGTLKAVHIANKSVYISTDVQVTEFIPSSQTFTQRSKNEIADVFSIDGKTYGYVNTQGQIILSSGNVSQPRTINMDVGPVLKFGHVLGDYYIVVDDSLSSGIIAYDLINGSETRVDNVYITLDNIIASEKSIYFRGYAGRFGNEPFFMEEGDSRILSGSVYEDLNNNGIKDLNEPLLPGVTVTVKVDNELVSTARTDSTGSYKIRAFLNSPSTICIEPPPCIDDASTPNSYHIEPVNIELDNIFDIDNLDFGVRIVNDTAKLVVSQILGQTRCNEEANLSILFENIGCSDIDGESIISIPPNSQLISSSIPLEVLSDNRFKIVDFYLPLGRLLLVDLVIQMPNEFSTGEELHFMTSANYSITPGSTIFAYASNTASTILSCAYDPNDKLVSPARVDPDNRNYTLFDESLTYTIRFQNTGNDTAQRVRLVDILDTNLITSTFRPVAASHDYTYKISADRTLTVDFSEINLVDSTTNLLGSQGFFQFRIMPQESSVESEIKNTASIYFDFNAPVVTNTVSNTIVETLDKDEDGSYFWLDCDDDDPNSYPGAIDIEGNGIDENCDGIDGTILPQIPTSSVIKIHPNPTSEEVTIESPTDNQYTLTFIDIKGANVKEYDIQTSPTLLDVNEFQAGLYFLQFTNIESGEQNVHKLIIVK